MRISPLSSPTTIDRKVRRRLVTSSTSLTRPSIVALRPGMSLSTAITDGFG